jgi:hypothetical protein
MKQIVNKLKPDYPNHAFSVNVDCTNLSFKAATKLKCGKDETSQWVMYKQPIPIPELALDVSIRKVPEDFKVVWPTSPRKNSRSSEAMEVQTVTGNP